MKISPVSNWNQENLTTLINTTNYIRQYLENKLEDKSLQLLPSDIIPPNSALAKLCYKFRLTEFERDILLLCVTLEIDPKVADLCAKIQGNPQLNYPTFALALATFPQASWFVLSPHNSLQYWRLIEIGTSFTLTQAPLRIQPHIFSYLLGEPSFDKELWGFIYPVPSHLEQIPLAPSQEKIVEQIVLIWSELSYTYTYPTLQLCAEESTAKYAIAKTLSVHFGFNLYLMSSTVFSQSHNDIQQIKQRWEREALLHNNLLLIECENILPTESKLVFEVCQFAENLLTPIIICSQKRLQAQHDRFITFDIPQLNYQEQTDIWITNLGLNANKFPVQISKLVSQFNLSSTTIQAICQQFKIQNSKLKAETENCSVPSQLELGSISSDSEFEKLWNLCRSQARPQLEGLAQRIETSATWDDLVLPSQQFQVLTDIATHLRQKAKVYQEWGFVNKGYRGLGISVLFHGESGTGKTMAAEILANEFCLDLYRIDLSAVISKYIGETEKNLERIFLAAETGGAILLFDEADALFGKRTEVQDSRDRHANVEVSYLLQRMEVYQGLTILTTNLKAALDSAFERRIRFMVGFPFPDAASRTKIWQRIFPIQTPTQGFDYQLLGQLKVAGGNIRNIALNAAFLAADYNEPVMMKHILQATQREYYKLKKMLTDEEIRGWSD
ncbi:ATP-binding protein [Okeania sp. SIO2B3]|uniref:ATP-binding protein n=1 Tax=Okeania sp. SIO2B3 TaxID=2607784 RepID=UPI0013C29D25|nr:ATP-binding protein [Okeania sp. SIO2B3]NET44182.1 ATP-binding protein [Okeania sp. SIO2B3]